MSYNIENSHISVLLQEVLEKLAPKDNQVIVDATFGAGGYTKAILDAANVSVIGLDRDPDVEVYVNNIASIYGEKFKFVNTKFSNIEQAIKTLGINKVDGIVLDLGVSSMQFDYGLRGFSFSHDGPLDMRMDKQGISAEEIVNTYRENDLADLIYEFGEEHNSRRIARKIVEYRATQPITTTGELRRLIHSVSKKRGNIDSATKTFQALRIYVNKELDELHQVLEASKKVLKKNGRLVVVSFHSLEDRIAKFYFRENTADFHIITKKVIKPAREEVLKNPRSRSAKLRAVEFLGHEND
jgi:16S rRNA (cytosine1402-N4)-methyltransferase